MSTTANCPHCGWPADDPYHDDGSVNASSTGAVTYRRCVCGSWLVLTGGQVVGATGPRQLISSDSSDSKADQLA